MNELFDEKLKVALGLIIPGRNADEALKYTQAVLNLTQARNAYVLTPEKPVSETEKPKK